MSNFLLTTQIISVFITIFGIILSFRSPNKYIKYFPALYSLVMALTLGPLFWNLGIIAADQVLLENMQIEQYEILYKELRKVMFPAWLQPNLMILQFIPLAIAYQKAKAKFHMAEFRS